MRDFFTEALRALSNDPFLQGSLAAFCTFILEDPTMLACGLLVADGRMGYVTALLGMAIGIGLGDLGLYLAGRLLGPRIVAWGFVSRGRLDRIGAWFEENMFTAIMVSRFIPGLRLPANVAAGMSRAALRQYLPAALFASIAWTLVALTLISHLGRAVMPILGELKWPVGIALVIFVIYMQRRSYRQMRTDPRSATAEEAPASFFEFWHPVIFYAPVAAYYLLLALRFRSLTLPTAANPAIYSGGMIRESKSQILDLVPESVRQWVAPYTTYVFADDDRPLETHAEAFLKRLSEAGLQLPIVAKPDLGQRGAGVRPLYRTGDVRAYLELFPRNTTIVLQKLVPFRHEAGLMYYRLPGEDRGRIISVTLKEFPVVVGDGERTLKQLIEDDSRARLMSEVFFQRHRNALDQVVPEGEDVQLVFSGNHAQGCVFKNGLHILTPALVERIDEIAHALPQYYFGRFDIRFRDLPSFQRGEAFQIVEINGAGAEATHIWDPDGTLTEAYRALFEQFRLLFAIGDRNRRRGHAPIGPIRFAKDVIIYFKLARTYPLAE